MNDIDFYDFYVAIQYVLERAKDNGCPLDKIQEIGKDAIDEFIEKYEVIEDEEE